MHADEEGGKKETFEKCWAREPPQSELLGGQEVKALDPLASLAPLGNRKFFHAGYTQS